MEEKKLAESVMELCRLLEGKRLPTSDAATQLYFCMHEAQKVLDKEKGDEK